MVKVKTPIPAFYLSRALEAEVEAYTPIEFGPDQDLVKMHLPVLSPPLLSKIIEELHQARDQYLSTISVFEIITSIDKAIALWSKPDYPPRKQALELLPTITGFSPQMIAAILDGIVPMFRGMNLLKLLQEELGDPLVLDEFCPRPAVSGLSKAYGPRLTTVIFAGNVPGLPIANIVYALLMKSAILGKSSSEEPLFAALFAKTLAEVNPELARCVAMVSWKGGDEAIEKQTFGASDAVIVYGSEHSVNEVRKRVPTGVRFIPYGHKLSFGIVGREALAADQVKKTAEKAARDVSLFDQQGCLSPHVLFAEEGGEISPRGFAGLLAEAMEAFNGQIPRGRISVHEAAHINQLRGAYEFKGLKGDDVAVYSSNPGTDWTVIYEKDSTFVPSCLNRTIRVKPVADVADVVKLVEPVKSYLQTMGAALFQKRLIPLANKMGQLGIDRICPLGKMTAPSLLWRHDGRFNLLDLLRWTDVEAEFGRTYESKTSSNIEIKEAKMKGKVCLVTGANSGIGKATAEGLARMGATVVMLCRNRLRGTIAMSEIMRSTNSNALDLMIADLSSQKDIHKFAAKFLDKYERLDVLVNNAGISVGKRVENSNGIEMTFAANYLAPFLLTHLLLEKLKASAPSRVVNVSSFVHRWTNKVNFDDLQAVKKYSATQVYAQSKLAILMFTYELARRLEGTGITVNALNPGLVKTNLGHDLTGSLKVLGEVLKHTLAITSEKGALTSIYLASSPEVEGITGQYFFKSKPKKSSKASYNQQAWKCLWEISEELTTLSKEQRLKRAVYRDTSVQLTERSGV